MNRTLFALVILGFSGIAMPCMSPPQKLFQDHAAIIKKASTILLVEAISNSSEQENACQFRVVLTLKGDASNQQPIICRLPSTGDWLTHFSAHSDPKFWQERSGRLGIRSDCTLNPPSFENGHYYLVLLGGTPDTKQFEEIAGPSDSWFLFVKEHLSRGKK